MASACPFASDSGRRDSRVNLVCAGTNMGGICLVRMWLFTQLPLVHTQCG